MIKTIASLIIPLSFLCSYAADSLLTKSMSETMADRIGACVFIDCASGQVFSSNSTESMKRLPPCSSFKIWNTLIGAECKLITSPDQPFFKWDSVTRSIPDWNKDLTLKEAFRVSCVPAFQNLARKIGPVQMQKWIDTIGYGDRDISSGIDIFWLPTEGKKAILISPQEQAVLISKLINQKVPFSTNSVKILRDIMFVKKSARGTFYGKTGTGADFNGDPKKNIAWFVGFTENQKAIYSFACVVKGENLTGKDARGIVETILVKAAML
jgi:beta-lactamase class D